MADRNVCVGLRSRERKRKSTPPDLQFSVSDDHDVAIEEENQSGEDDVETDSCDDYTFHEGELNSILVKTDTSKVISLEVNGSDTVGSMKLKIEEMEDIPVDHQQLLLNQKLLDNFSVLANLPIKKDSVLTLLGGSISKEFVNILIKTPIGSTICWLEVKPSDTISDVKAKTGCTGGQYVMIFNKVVLEDSATVGDLHMTNGSILTLACKLVERIKIFVNTFTGKTISLFVHPRDAITSVKRKIKRMEHVLVVEQALIFNDMVLEDSGTLSDFHIIKNSTLKLIRITNGFVSLFIKTPYGKTISFNVKPFDTIHNVKSKIHEREAIPPCQQRLMFVGQLLEHDKLTIADYQIQNQSTIHLLLRLR